MSYQQIPLIHSSEEQFVYKFLSRYGEYAHYKTDTEREVTVFPTCTTPLEHLVEENWGVKSREHYCGNFRQVRQISRLCDGTPVYLFAKGPERRFTTSNTALERGRVWWGGPRSGEKYVVLSDRVVEEAVLWEAVFLLELHEQNIRAEIPQAVVEYQGRKEVIVQGIPTDYTVRSAPDQPSYEETRDKIAGLGIIPSDDYSCNLVSDTQGYNHIIDVNRWVWKPHTDDFSARLFAAVQRAVTKRKT